MYRGQLVPPGWSLELRGADADLRLTGDWIARETGVRDIALIRDILDRAGGAERLRIDTRSLGRWDSALIAFLLGLRQEAATVGRQPHLDESDVPEAARRLLALATESAGLETRASAAVAASLFTQVGTLVISGWSRTVAVSALVGQVALRVGAALSGRLQTRAGDIMQLMADAGAGALVIVTIVNAMVGGILAFVGAVQFRRYGTQIFVADLVGIAMVREMAAIVTGVVMAGRTGGAYAAHIATMQGNEEIDALKVLGIRVYDYLVLPRVIALTAMMPLLYFYACAVGLLGGFVVALTTLDLSAAAYLEETRGAISGTQFLIGVSKSATFGALVALAGCHIGMRAGRSAADVGRAATSAVVAGIIGIIAIDAVFAMCTNALDI
jgi:phospholipid/cholesterol/gamma-HCH transport system permease protein